MNGSEKDTENHTPPEDGESRRNPALSGIYVVVDPAMEEERLVSQLRKALEGGVSMIQIWNHWPEGADKERIMTIIRRITDLARPCEVPVLVNEEWSLLEETRLEGVHFDDPPDPKVLDMLREREDLLLGITCSNDEGRVAWAEREGFDYISFCSMFPSGSVDRCEIVRPDTVRRVRSRSELPLFISGGLTPDSIRNLAPLDVDGCAVISGIMNSEDPAEAVRSYREAMKLLSEEETKADET